MNKLIITKMEICQVPCYVCAREEDGRIMELRFEPIDHKSALGNIYVGQVENIAANIGAAFVQISAGERCYLQLSDVQEIRNLDFPISFPMMTEADSANG